MLTCSCSSSTDRFRLDEVLCILEALASMTLAPAVADVALPPSAFVTQVQRAGPFQRDVAPPCKQLMRGCASQMIVNLRSRPEVQARGRERTHLLLLYGVLCGCVTCREARVSEFVKDILLLAGAELGLHATCWAAPADSSCPLVAL